MAKIKIKVKEEYLKTDEFAGEVGKRSELKKEKVKEVYKHTADVIKEEIVKGHKVVVPHIGTITPTWRPEGEREGITNPGTGDRGTVKISERYGVKFHADAKVRAFVDEEAKKADLKKDIVVEVPDKKKEK